MKTKKVFDRIFKTIQMVVNAVMAIFCAVIAFGSLYTSYVSSDAWGAVVLCVIGMIGFNVLNVYIRKLINNY